MATRRAFIVAVLSTVLLSLPGQDTNAQAAADLESRIRTVESSLGPRGNDDPSIRWSLEERMAFYGVPGVSIAVIESYHGNENAFLAQETARDMMTAVPPGIYGLGPEVGGEGETLNFVHGGANNSYRALMAGYTNLRGGLVIFTNGTRGNGLIGEIRRAVEVAGWPSH